VYLLIGIVSVLFVLLASSLMLGVVHRIRDWSYRRPLQCSVLFLPLVMLGLGLCSSGLLFQDIFPGGVLLLMMGGIALGALGMGIARLVLMARLVSRRALFINPELQMLADGLAQQFGGAPPRVRLYPSDRPLALTCGFRKPIILLSSWMVAHLDRRELEAVLVHELEHVARHDYLVIWVATILRDAFFYLPTSWIAYRQLQHEKELACDDFTVGVTQRPLALASALTKVWLQAVDVPVLAKLGGAQALTRAEASINERIKRLLAPSMRGSRRPHRAAFSLNMAVLLPFGVFEAACIFLLLLSTLGGCHPIGLCGRL